MFELTYLLVDVRQAFHARKESAADAGSHGASAGDRRRANRVVVCKAIGGSQRRKASSRVDIAADASGEKRLRAKECQFLGIRRFRYT